MYTYCYALINILIITLDLVLDVQSLLIYRGEIG